MGTQCRTKIALQKKVLIANQLTQAALHAEDNPEKSIPGTRQWIISRCSIT